MAFWEEVEQAADPLNVFGGNPAYSEKNKPPEAPTPPDPLKMIQEQAKANYVNQYGPNGSLEYTQSPDGRWSVNRNFSPELKGIYDQQLGLLKTPMSTDFSGDSTRMEQATFDRAKALLDPMFSEQGRSLEQKLANQGLPMGGEAYTGEMDRFDRNRGEAYNRAALDSVMAGRQEQGRLFGQQMQGRQSQFNQLAALLGGQQAGATPPIDAQGAFDTSQNGIWNQYNATMQGWNQQRQTQNQNMAGIASLVGAFL